MIKLIFPFYQMAFASAATTVTNSYYKFYSAHNQFTPIKVGTFSDPLVCLTVCKNSANLPCELVQYDLESGECQNVEAGMYFTSPSISQSAPNDGFFLARIVDGAPRITAIRLKMLGSGEFNLPNTMTLTYCNDVNECCTHTGLTGYSQTLWNAEYLSSNHDCYHFPARFLNTRPGYPKATITTLGMDTNPPSLYLGKYVRLTCRYGGHDWNIELSSASDVSMETKEMSLQTVLWTYTQ